MYLVSVFFSLFICSSSKTKPIEGSRYMRLHHKKTTYEPCFMFYLLFTLLSHKKQKSIVWLKSSILFLCNPKRKTWNRWIKNDEAKCDGGKKVHSKHEGLLYVSSIVALNLSNPLFRHTQRRKQLFTDAQTTASVVSVKFSERFLSSPQAYRRHFWVFIFSLLSSRVKSLFKILCLLLIWSWNWVSQVRESNTLR